jgi:ribonuclease HII
VREAHIRFGSVLPELAPEVLQVAAALEDDPDSLAF